MGRYSAYFNDIWKLKANRKVIGISLFGTILDNTVPFTPGDQLTVVEGADQAISMLSQKGYDFLVITGQPTTRTRNLVEQDFENIISAMRDVFSSLGSTLKFAYYAPGTDKNDPYVRPNPGMFERAQKENMIKWSETMFVGSEANDVKAALKVSATPILIRNATNKDLKIKTLELVNNTKVQEFNSLLEFANSVE